MTLRTLLLALLALSISSNVLAEDFAPPLMRSPSKVAFVPAGVDFPGDITSFGMDDTGAIYGVQSTFIRCWPKGMPITETGKFLFDLQPPNLPLGMYWLGMTADFHHAMFARRVNGLMTMGKLRCDLPTQAEPMQISNTDDPLLATWFQANAGQGRRLVSTPDGAPCIQVDEGVHCYGPDKKIVRSFTAADAIPQLDINPEWALYMTSKPPPDFTKVTPPNQLWRVSAFTFAPDGRMFVLLDLHIGSVYPGKNPGQVRWLLEQAPGGKIRMRSRAMVESRECGGGQPQVSPLYGVSQLQYSAEHKAILAWAVFSWDLKNNEQQSTSKVDDGSPPLGIRVFPLDAELESGYVSLTDTYAAWFGRKSRGPVVYDRPGGGLLLEMNVTAPTANPNLNGRLFDIKIDMPATDLDLDGLTGAEEAALGTSPWLQDSDGGGNPDRDEVIAGTKPLDPHDDPIRTQDLHRMAYSISSLLRWRVGNAEGPPPATDPWGSQRIGGERLESQPFCLKGTCRGRSGEILATYSAAEAWGNQPQSIDGRLVVLRDATQYRLLHVPEGVTEPLINVADVEQVLDPGIGMHQLFAVNRKEIYAHRLEGRRIVVLGDGPPRLAFDLDAVRCASGLGCAKDTGFAGYRYTLDWQGYDAKLQRLLVAIREKDNNLGRAWIVGVHATKPPVLLANIHESWGTAQQDFGHVFDACTPATYGMAVPTWATDTGRGDLLTDLGRKDVMLQNLPADFDMYGDPVQRVWDDTLVQIGDGALYEVVQIPEKVEPGELLAFTYDNNVAGSEHGTLWHIPARGGKAEVFRLPNFKVSGMNVAADGRVCLAAPDPGVFMQVRAHALSFGMPNLQLTELHVGKVVDCDYGPDGRPHLLMTDPPRVLVWNGKDDTKNPDEMKDFETRLLDPLKVPFQLLVEKDGKDRVLYDHGPILGMGRLQDGSIAEVDAATQKLRIHGALVGPDLSTWINDLHLHSPGQMQFTMAAISWLGLRVHVAQRPDGLIAVLPYLPLGGSYADAGTSPPTTVLAWDPRSDQRGEFTPLFARGMHNPHALAVMPGGVARDPWTGGPVVLPPASGSDATGADASGDSVKPGESAGPDDGGCTARPHGASFGGAWLLLLAWAGLWQLRRRSPR